MPVDAELLMGRPPRGAPSQPVRVRDSEYSGLVATFTYFISETGAWPLGGVEVTGDFLSPAKVLGLPLTRWERAARATLLARLRELASAGNETMKLFEDVGRLHPEATTPQQIRSHLRLARTAREYRAGLMSGATDPAAEIARAHDVKPGTARAWVHRARKAGYLGVAVGTVPGEKETHEGATEKEEESR